MLCGPLLTYLHSYADGNKIAWINVIITYHFRNSMSRCMKQMTVCSTITYFLVPKKERYFSQVDYIFTLENLLDRLWSFQCRFYVNQSRSFKKMPKFERKKYLFRTEIKKFWNFNDYLWNQIKLWKVLFSKQIRNKHFLIHPR